MADIHICWSFRCYMWYFLLCWLYSKTRLWMIPWQFYSCKALDFTADNPSGGRTCLLRMIRACLCYLSIFPRSPPPLCLSLALLQIVAAILAIAGIVMMTYADGFHSHSVIGITFVVASASMSALYKVCLSIWQHYYTHKTFLKWHLCCRHLWVNSLSRAIWPPF